MASARQCSPPERTWQQYDRRSRARCRCDADRHVSVLLAHVCAVAAWLCCWSVVLLSSGSCIERGNAFQMLFKCARDRSQWSRRPGMIHRLLRAVDKVPCAKHCRWRWPAVSCAAAARSRRAQLALCRRHALDRTGKQSWHAAAEPYTPHGNGLDETSTAAMEAVLRHRKPEKISPPEAPCTVLSGLS